MLARHGALTTQETPMTAEVRAYSMAQRMEQTRAETMRLFALVADETDLRQPPAPGFRPILWHRGHIGAYEAYWILHRSKGDTTTSAEFQRIFDPINTPRDDARNLPPLDEIDAYLADVRRQSVSWLSEPGGAADTATFDLVLEHELQHQETMLYLLHLLDPSRKRRPDGLVDRERPDLAATNGRVRVPAGSFEIGASGPGFGYDNERPAHRVEVRSFGIDRTLVTNAQFMGFVDSGGYTTPEYWTDKGWAWLESENIEHPHSWLPGRRWRVRGLFEDREMDPSEPVWGVSWYEADAYARWAGRRLPTEIEWEFAARGTGSRVYPWGSAEPKPNLGNFDDPTGGPTPVGGYPDGVSPFGLLDMTGNVWEWTSTEFAGYPGFRADPYPEYSELWFDGDHRVARGGSWATRSPILRTSFRNFFRRAFRIGFIGFRLAD
jgi:iron(II)-dependent oxidoreductase